MNSAASPLWPFILFFGCTVAVVMLLIAVSYILGQRHTGRVTGEPYESGMPLTGDARMRFSIKYYLVAMFFVIFDIEALFIIAWSVSARRLGWSGYIVIVIFIGILLVALMYLWRLGALDWGSQKHKPIKEAGV